MEKTSGVWDNAHICDLLFLQACLRLDVQFASRKKLKKSLACGKLQAPRNFDYGDVLSWWSLAFFSSFYLALTYACICR